MHSAALSAAAPGTLSPAADIRDRQIDIKHSHAILLSHLVVSETGGGICSESYSCRSTYLLKVGDHLEHIILAGLCQLPYEQQFGIQGGAVGCASHDRAQRRVHNEAKERESAITSDLSEAAWKFDHKQRQGLLVDLPHALTCILLRNSLDHKHLRRRQALASCQKWRL